MDISVIVPAYNHAQYILKCLDSVAQQAVELELLVVDDGSQDATSQVVDEFQDTVSLRYIYQNNSGQSAARNKGLGMATGKYVAFLDDDDYWPEGKLLWQLEALESQPSAVAVAGYAEAVNEANQIITTMNLRADIDQFTLFEYNPIFSPGQVLIRRDALLAIGGYDRNIWGADDWDLWFRLAKIGQIMSVQKLALYYRLHSSNASRNKARMLVNSINVLKKHLATEPPELQALYGRASFEHLFGWCGKQTVSQLKEGVRAVKPRQIASAIAALVYMARQAEASTIRKAILKELVPARLRGTGNGAS